MSASPEELLARLAASPGPPYPRAVVTEIISRRSEMTPALLGVLEEAAVSPEKYSMPDTGCWKKPVFAAYILAQGRETRAFRPLCATLNLPAEVADDLWGDMITEDLGRVVASVYDGDDEPLRSVVANAGANEYIRGATVPQVYASLLAGGKMQRRELEARTAEILGGVLEREYSFVWDGWLGLCADCGLAALEPLIRKAIDEDLYDPFYDEPEAILSAATSGGRETSVHRTGFIDDVIAETEWWACWSESDPSPPQPDFPRTVASPIAKIGRNAACPCGSGRKYKKCCGAP